ncbi:MAG: hypothetical protein ACYTE3_03030 [Planctomycetota bacterium]|jgi:hypothetical protein
MKDRDRENLAELLGRFFDAEEAGGVLEDFRQGEQILHENPAPKPDRALLANIKAEIALLLPARRAQFARRRMYRRVGVAAAFIIIAAISAVLFNGSPREPGRPLQLGGVLPTEIWESNNIAVDDENLAVVAGQIGQIENEVMTLESGDEPGYSDRAMEEMESELIVVRTAFWKE